MLETVIGAVVLLIALGIFGSLIGGIVAIFAPFIYSDWRCCTCHLGDNFFFGRLKIKKILTAKIIFLEFLPYKNSFH